VAVGIVTAGIVAAVNRRHQLTDAARHLGHLRLGWVLVALAAQAVSMLAFARVQQRLLRSGRVEVPFSTMAGITLGGNALAMSLPGGAAFSLAWSYGRLRKRGATSLLAGWVVLMAGALSSFALFVILATGTELAGGDGPVASLRALALALAAIPVAVVVVALLAWRIPAVHRALTRLVAWVERRRRGAPLVAAGRRLGERLRLVQPSPGAWAEAFAFAALNWLADLVCLLAAASAVGGHVPWRGILVAYGLAQLLVALPFTPGGFALVEGGLTAVLVAYGMATDTALAATLLYRIISFWLLVPVGLAAYAWLTFGHHRDEGETETAPPYPSLASTSSW
jgi:uncharacterized membrane protein YbhN (UPF0104 family)